MRITDLTPENESLYFCCLEDWSEELKEAGDHKQRWYEKMKDKGLRVKFAVDDQNVIGGMIQYMPVEYTMVDGERLFLVLCIWVHGHKKGRGDYRKRGMGTALLNAAEEDVKALGSDGLVTWGVAVPAFMRASWFRKKGYKVVDKNGVMRLLWKPFSETASPPRFMKKKKSPEKGSDTVNISLFCNGWCPSQNMVYERAKRACAEFPGKVHIDEYDTKERAVVDEWGIFDALFIDDKEVWTGPPPSYEKLKRKIARRVSRLPE